MKKHKVLKITFSIIGCLLVIVLIFGGIMFFNAKKSLSLVNKQENLDMNSLVPDYKEKEKSSNNPSILRILLLGLDDSDDGNIDSPQRSDTMMLVSINKDTNQTNIISIPRDTYVESFSPSPSKINSAYAYGKNQLATYAVEELLNIKEEIPYYIAIDFNGLVDLVDAVGGVDVNNAFEFSFGSHHFPVGEQTLNGEEALSYSRMRKEDANGDYGRQNRQRQITQSLFTKLSSPSIILRYNDILKSVENHVRTNITVSNGLNILKNYSEALKNQTTHQIEGTSEMINGSSYEVVSLPDDYLEEIENKFNTNVEISE